MDAIIDALAEILAPFTWTRISARARRDLADWCDIRVTSPLAVLAGLNCVAGLIVLKSQGPGSAFRLSDSRLCLAAAAAAGLAIASRWALANCQRGEPAFWIKVLLAAFSVLPLAALFTVATPRNSLLAIGVVCALAVVTGNANLLWKRKRGDSLAESDELRLSLRDISDGSRAPLVAPISLAEPPVVAAPRELHRTAAAAEWLERTTDESSNAVVQGTVVARFAAGQSLTTAHIPFQPPFDRLPEFSCEAVDSPAARVRTPAVFRYGTRLELKRSGDISHPAQVPVQFRAVARSHSLRAA